MVSIIFYFKYQIFDDEITSIENYSDTKLLLVILLKVDQVFDIS